MRRTVLVYLLCCAVWGSTWAVIKVGLSDLPPFLFAGTRMLLTCLLLTPLFLRARARWPDARAWKVVLSVGALQIGVSYACVFAGETVLSSAMSALLFSTFPVWTAVFAHFALPGERLTPSRVGAALLALAGAAVVEWPALHSFREAVQPAVLFPLGAAIASAIGNVWLKKSISHVPGTVSLWGQTLVGGAFLLVLSGLFERHASVRVTPGALGALLYLTLFGTVLTFLALFWLIPRLPMVAIGIIPIIDTCIAVLLGVAFLSEPFTPSMAVGGAMVLAAAALAARGAGSAGMNLPAEQAAR